jgi:hypothetical protein
MCMSNRSLRIYAICFLWHLIRIEYLSNPFSVAFSELCGLVGWAITFRYLSFFVLSFFKMIFFVLSFFKMISFPLISYLNANDDFNCGLLAALTEMRQFFSKSDLLPRITCLTSYPPMLFVHVRNLFFWTRSFRLIYDVVWCSQCLMVAH